MDLLVPQCMQLAVHILGTWFTFCYVATLQACKYNNNLVII